MLEPKENRSPQPKKPLNVTAIMAGVTKEMKDREQTSIELSKSTKLQRNTQRAEKLPFSPGDATTDIDQQHKQTSMKSSSSKRMKTKLVTGVKLTGQRPDDPKSIENK